MKDASSTRTRRLLWHLGGGSLCALATLGASCGGASKSGAGAGGTTASGGASTVTTGGSPTTTTATGGDATGGSSTGTTDAGTDGSSPVLPAGWLYTNGAKIYVSDGKAGGTPWMGRGVNVDDIFLCGYNNTLWMTAPTRRSRPWCRG